MKISKKITLLPLLVIFASCNLFSCKDSSKHNKKEFENTNILSMEDMPNENTKYDTIRTTNITDNYKLISFLKSKLEIADFTFEERESRGGFSYNNCEENRITLIHGDGIREYFARSRRPEKGTKNFYPDFVILVYEFPTNEIASQNGEILEKALNSAGEFCNGKTPEKIVTNGNEIFHLSTRAEMFRTYTEKYGEMIKNYR